jgi:lysophospholipase L1-like esterase
MTNIIKVLKFNEFIKENINSKSIGDHTLLEGVVVDSNDTLNLLNSILFVGDSITVADFSYANLIKKQYPKKDIQVLAKGGMRTKWMLDNLKIELNKKHYDRVYIYGGINDMFSAITIEDAISNIQQMVNLVIAQKGEAYVIIGYDAEIFIDKNKLKTTDYVPTIEGMYKLRDRYILFQNKLSIDIRNAKVINKINLSSKYGFDAVHPAASGHLIIKDIILKDIKNIASSNKSFSKSDVARKKYDKDVEYMQTALLSLGFFLPKWGVDGKFGDETEQAVKSFQDKNGLTVSGVIDKDDFGVMVNKLSVV